MCSGVTSQNITFNLNDMENDEDIPIDADDWSDETLNRVRFIVQRVLVPCIVTIGIAGNLLTVIVLTR